VSESAINRSKTRLKPLKNKVFLVDGRVVHSPPQTTLKYYPNQYNHRDWQGVVAPHQPGGLIMTVSNPRLIKDLKVKKTCDIKKLKSAKEVLEGKRCKRCGSKKIIRYDKSNGKQRYRCKYCGMTFHFNHKFPRMRTNYMIIAHALDLYFEGLSLRKVQRQLKRILDVRVNISTIWRWIQKYEAIVRGFMQSLTPKTKKGILHVDETAILIKTKKKGVQCWYWDCIDRDSRYIVGTHISKSKYVRDAKAVFMDVKEQIKGIPNMVICDGLPAYYEGLKKAFGGMTVKHKIIFVQRAGISKKMPSNNNRIERFHNTLKARTKVMRGLKTPKGILDGFRIHYNLIRDHMTLKNTPARTAGIKLPFTRFGDIDGWEDLIQFSIIFANLQ